MHPAHQRHHAFGAIRIMRLQPFGEEPGDLERQAQQDIAGFLCACLCGGFQ
jgi:hypothetical protein